MSKNDIEELEKELQKNYNGFEIFVEFAGAVTLSFKIQNLKSLVSQQTIFLSDGEYKELEIQVDMITDLEITENSINIYMFDNYCIKIENTGGVIS